MEDPFFIREATKDDVDQICNVLVDAQLSAHAVLALDTRYWLAENVYHEVVGTVGLELGKTAVLLRSACVLMSWRGQGVGTALTEYVLDVAASGGYAKVYLFSTGAGAYWTRYGFYEVPVSEVVAALPDVPQVRQYQEFGWLATEVAWRLDLAHL